MVKTTLTREGLFERVLLESKGGCKGSASARKARTIMLQGLTFGKLELVWQRLAVTIAESLRTEKGVHVPQIGRFGLNRADENRPCFVIAESWARAHGVDAGSRKPVQLGTMTDLSLTKLSLETRLPKDEVKAIITTLFHCLGIALEDRQQAAHVELNEVGSFQGDHGRLWFDYGSRRSTRARQHKRSVEGEDDERSVASFQREPLASSRTLCLTGRSSSSDSASSSTFARGGESEAPDLPVPKLNLIGGSSSNDMLGRLQESKYEDTSFHDAADGLYDFSESEDNHSLASEFMDKLGMDKRPRTAYAGSVASSDSWDVSTEASGPIVHPIFLHRDRRTDLLHTFVEDRQNRRSKALRSYFETEFKRIAEELKDDLSGLEQQDRDIARRNEISEMAYRDKLLQMKRDQLDLNEFLIKQAQERRDREGKERADLRGSGRIFADEGPKAFPVEGDPDYIGAALTKARLKDALRSQIRDRTRRQREERANNIAEERLLVDSNVKLLRADRVKQAKKRERTRRDLQEHWRKQTEIAGMQRLLTEAKNGKIIAHTQSEAGLLTVRSVRGSARQTALALTDPSSPI